MGIVFMVAFNGNRTNGDYDVGGDNQMSAGAGYKYLYDDEGNREFRFISANETLGTGDTEITKYTWDHRNRLVKVEHFDDYEDYAAEDSDQSFEYAYDYQNRLIHRTLDPDGSAESEDPIEQTAYVYDGNQVVLQFEKTGTGDILATDLKHRDLWGPAVDQLLAQENVHYNSGTQQFVTDELFWALTDNLNTVRDLVSYNGSATSLASHRVFDAFGNKKYETDAVDCVFNYTGKLLDDDTGLQNNLNRWYEPATGKWLSKDPIGFEGRDVNLYRYVLNIPTNAIDSNGNRTCTRAKPLSIYWLPFGQYVATAGGWGVDISLNPSWIGTKPISVIHCSGKVRANVKYSCTDTLYVYSVCWPFSSTKTITYFAYLTMILLDEYDASVWPQKGSITINGVEIPIPRVPFGNVTYYQITSAEEQKQANTICNDRWPSYRHTYEMPPPTIND